MLTAEIMLLLNRCSDFQVMYENRGRLLCMAEVAALKLFENIVTVAEAHKRSPRSSRSQKHDDPDLCVDNELGFAKDRTIGM
jgi:hypothetical protein